MIHTDIDIPHVVKAWASIHKLITTKASRSPFCGSKLKCLWSAVMYRHRYSGHSMADEQEDPSYRERGCTWWGWGADLSANLDPDYHITAADWR